MLQFKMERAVVQEQLLSYYCSSDKKTIKNNKLNLFGKGIVIVDELKLGTLSLQSILELDLSHNSIHRIDNLKQFSNLQIINLSHNQIEQATEVSHLRQLKRLVKVSLKKNPFLNVKIPLSLIQFLFSLQTDICCVSQDIQRKLNETTKQIIEVQCFSNYEKKIRMHIQLIDTVKTDANLSNPGISTFPKVKKILELYEKDIKVRKWYVSQMKEELFCDERALLKHLEKESENMKEIRSSSVRNIYEIEDTLKKGRESMSQRSKGKLSEKILFAATEKKISKDKINNVVSKLQRNIVSKENSPPKLSSQFRGSKQELYLQQNYLTILIKVNPLYHLLHSPLPSLKNHQKDLLLENLLPLLKDKMKEICRYQQLQRSHTTLKNDFISLQQHLQWITAQVKKEQDITEQKHRKLQLQCQDQSTKIEEMKLHLQNNKEVIQRMTRTNLLLTEQVSNLELQSLGRESQEDRCEQISKSKEGRLLKRYLMILNKKAFHYSSIKILRQVNSKQQQNEIKQIIFNEFRQNVIHMQNQKFLKCAIYKRCSKKYIDQMINFHKILKNIAVCQISRKKKQLNHFKRQAELRHQQGIEEDAKIFQINKVILKRIKKSSLQLFRKMRNQISKEEINSELQKFRKRLVLAQSFRGWVRYLAQYDTRIQEQTYQIEKKKKFSSLSLFMKRCRKSIDFSINVHALQSFLLHYRKISSYLNFTKYVGSVLFNRQIKAMKVRRLNQYRYFEYFVSKIRDMRLKRKIKIDISAKEQQIKFQETLQNQKKLREKRKALQIRFKQTVLKAYFWIQKKMLQREKTIYQFSQEKTLKSVIAFYSKLQSHHKVKMKISHKMELFRKSFIVAGHIKLFFRNLAIRLTQINHKKKVQRSKLQSIVFYRWKSFAFWSRMQVYKSKFESLEPQISKISALQGQLKDQKKSLMLQLEEKELMIQQYRKKCEQYEYTLHSKNIKYQKLKDIYAESIQLKDLNNTIKVCDYVNDLNQRPREREEDIYKKYLPSGMTGKIEEFDLLRTPIPRYYEPDVESIREHTFRKEEGVITRPFLSTFRKF